MTNSVTQEDISSQVSSTTGSKRITAFNKSERMEVWTREYLVDRLFFEMIEIRDEGEGWEDYQHIGQKKKYYDRGADAIKMVAGRPRLSLLSIYPI